MGFLKKIAGIFSAPEPQEMAYWVNVRCKRCGEVIRTRVNLRSELSRDEEDGKLKYFCHKTLIGSERCFQPVEVRLTFDKDFALINREISGGEFVDE